MSKTKDGQFPHPLDSSLPCGCLSKPIYHKLMVAYESLNTCGCDQRFSDVRDSSLSSPAAPAGLDLRSSSEVVLKGPDDTAISAECLGGVCALPRGAYSGLVEVEEKLFSCPPICQGSDLNRYTHACGEAAGRLLVQD